MKTENPSNTSGNEKAKLWTGPLIAIMLFLLAVGSGLGYVMVWRYFEDGSFWTKCLGVLAILLIAIVFSGACVLYECFCGGKDDPTIRTG